MIHGKRKKWATWKYSTTKNSMDDCIKTFSKHVPGKRKKKVSVIQYNKKNKKCYGQNSSNLTGKRYNDPKWSFIDTRPRGYYSKGNYIDYTKARASESDEIPSFSDHVIDGKVYKWKKKGGYLYWGKRNSMDDCIKTFTRHVPGKRKKKVSIIQYNKKTKKCYGQNSENIIGNLINSSFYSTLDIRPGYLSEGKYNTG